MRRALFSITAVLGVVMLPASAGVAAVGTRGPVLQAQAKPKAVCTVTDPRLVELSGLVATKSGYIVVNDSTDLEERRKIFYLNQDCAVTNAVDYSGAGPYDTEDLALSPDRKTLWIADTGDNITSAQRRERVALWSMPVSGNKPPSLHRLAYPEKAPHDAEALLIADDGTPIIITKSLSGSKIFVPDGPLQTDNETPVPMKEVGRLKLPRTSTDNLLGTSGRVLVTGAARSPDGSKVVVRTYADAFEFDVPNGDIVKALTDGKPRATALADPFGEAIAYTADGKWFLTVSEIADVASATDLQILRYQPSTTVATEAPVPGAGAPGSEDSFFQSLSLQQITYLIAGVGVVGVLLVAAGVTGILRARRKPAAKGAADDAEGAAAGEEGGRRRRGAAAVNEPGGRGEPVPAASARAAAAAAGVYGGAPRDGGASRDGAVYGGAAPAGGVYGGARAAGPGADGVYGGRGTGPAAAGGGRPSRGGVYGGSGPEPGSGGGHGRGPAGGGGYGGPAPSERGGRPGGPGGRPGGPGVYGGRSGGGRDENEGRGRHHNGYAQEPPVRGRGRRSEDPGRGEAGYREPRQGEPGYNGPRYDDRGYDERGYDRRGHRDPGYDDRHRGGGYR